MHIDGAVMQPSESGSPAGSANAMLISAPLTRAAVSASWIMQVIAALILFQTLFFKFAGAPESVYIFTTLGLEPWGRIGSGVAELIAGVLLLTPRLVPVGAALSLGVISGAIMSHLTKLGIAVQNDGGLLFALALVVFACSAGVLLIRRSKAVAIIRALLQRVRPA